MILGAGGAVDEAGTAQRRREIRAERLGRGPEREPEPMLEYRSPLRLEQGKEPVLACNHCGHELARGSANWKDAAAARSWPLVERAKHLGIPVRPRRDPAMWMWELCCPSCATLLEVNVYEEGETPPRDISLGETSDEPGEPF